MNQSDIEIVFAEMQATQQCLAEIIEEGADSKSMVSRLHEIADLADDLQRGFKHLNDWIMMGGELPQQWRRAGAKTLVNLPAVR